MLPDLAVGRISAPSLPETLSHVHLKKLLRYVPGLCGSGVCCWLVGQSVWLLACHTSLSVPFLWVCNCTQQFPCRALTWLVLPREQQVLPTWLGRAWQAPAHSRAAALALSTARPGSHHSLARLSPQPGSSRRVPLHLPSHVPSPELPRPGRLGFPPTEAVRGRHHPPGREGRRRPSRRFCSAASASGMLW